MKRAIPLVLVLCINVASAQHFAGIANGYYAGIHGAKLNPALPAYSAWNWHVNLVGAWVNVNNNYLTLKLPYSAYKFIGNRIPQAYLTESGNPQWNDAWLKERITGRVKHVGVGGMLYGPSFTIRYKTWNFGLLSDVTALGRISGISENLAHAAYKQFDTAKNAFQYFQKSTDGGINPIHRFAINASSWGTVGINVAKEIPLLWKQKVLVGVTLKRAWGLGGMYFKSDALQLHDLGNDSVSLDRTNIEYASYSGVGKGMGLDIGAVWVYHKPEYLQPGGYTKKHTMYLYKIGFSILDIGSIMYRNVAVTTITNNNPIGWNIANEKAKFDGQEPNAGMLNSVLGEIPNLQTRNQNVRIGLPTRMVASIDYQVKPHYFVNAQVVQSLRGKYGRHPRHQSYLMLAPRYESDFFEVSIPLLLEYDYRAFRAGAAFRVGPLYFGSNSIGSAIYTRSVRDADFYIGISFGDIPGKWRDRWYKEKGLKAGKKKTDDCEKM